MFKDIIKFMEREGWRRFECAGAQSPHFSWRKEGFEIKEVNINEYYSHEAEEGNPIQEQVKQSLREKKEKDK